MKNLFTLIILIVLSSCASTTIPTKDTSEILLQPSPFPSEEWVKYQEENVRMAMLTTKWKSKTSLDSIITFVLYRTPNVNLENAMEPDIKRGKASCDVLFEVTPISQDLQNGYPQITWVNECKTSKGIHTRTIHKKIAGNKSKYSISRVFSSNPSNNQLELWLNYIDSITVCSSIDNKHSCPAKM